MRTVLKIALMACGMVVAQAGSAQEYKETPKYRKCVNAIHPGAGEGAQYAACDLAELKRQDVVLNEVYGQLRSRMSKEQESLLINGQRAWLRHREAWCRFEETLSGSAMQNYSACVLDATMRQIDTLGLAAKRLKKDPG